MKNWIGPCAAMVLALCTVTAEAGVVGFQSDASTGSGLGAYRGSMDYSYDASRRAGTLSITLENTSVAANGGYLTGFGFNVDGSAFGLLSGEPRRSPWENLWSTSSRTLNPYGRFEMGASTSNKLASNKNARDGLAVGDIRTFTFTILGSDASSLDTMDFLRETSSGAKNGHSGQIFIARFGAFDDGGSDKVGARLHIVPLPAAGWAGLALLGGLGLVRSRRRRRLIRTA